MPKYLIAIMLLLATPAAAQGSLATARQNVRCAAVFTVLADTLQARQMQTDKIPALRLIADMFKVTAKQNADDPAVSGPGAYNRELANIRGWQFDGSVAAHVRALTSVQSEVEPCRKLAGGR
jgi:hypothetical protein